MRLHDFIKTGRIEDEKSGCVFYDNSRAVVDRV